MKQLIPPKKLREKHGKVKGGKSKPYRIQWRLSPHATGLGLGIYNAWKEWTGYGRYATRRAMDSALDAARKGTLRSFEFRQHPDNPP